MIKKVKRIIAGALAVITIMTAIPMTFVNAASDGEERTASIESLGKLGTVNIGNKSEGGTWVKTVVGDNDVFCLDLGKACHTGYIYVASNSTISSDSKNKSDALKAKIGYWYHSKKKSSNKAWVYAQCLIWSIEEGESSESDLKDIISQVKKNTGYYSDDNIYSDIFDISSTVTCNIIKWKYSNKTEADEVQELLEIVSDTKDLPFKTTSSSDYYRQRITLQKNDEDGKGLSGVSFKFTATNVKELYSYNFNGEGDAVTGDVDDGASKFSQEVKTDSNGKIAFRFTYKIHTKSYAYVEKQILDEMSSDDKKKVKDEMDDQGYDYASNLTKDGAEKLIEKDLEDQMDDISNKYIIEEISSGNDNIMSEFTLTSGSNKAKVESSKKVTVTLTKVDSWTRNKDKKWPETVEESYGNYKLAYKPVFKDNYKKVKMIVTKRDSEKSKAQGDATLEGAVYGIYSDAACTKLVKSYTTGRNGQFETDYMRCGTTRYMKEITAPIGYQKNNQVYVINENGKSYTAEYNQITKSVDEDVIKGDVSIIKGMGNGLAGIVSPEGNAQFEIFLASAGSFEKADVDEKDVLTTDIVGFAKSKKMPYGTYIVHQIKGKDNTELCPDFYVDIKENNKTYQYLLNNPEFEAYIKIVKKDSRTHQTVLKAGTTYQIYSVDKDGKETIVTQVYNTGNRFEVVDRFVTDSSGEIITFQKFKAGTYKVYEVIGPEGYHRNTKPVTITISDKSYKTMKDEAGNIYLYAECEYYNDETYGKVTINKTGLVLKNDIDLVNEDLIETEECTCPFKFMENPLSGVKFELTAREDIMSQDNQGTVLFEKGSVVATIISGKEVEFTKDYDNCKYIINEDGTITLDIPLGEYTLKETETRYGFVLPEKYEWDFSFKWSNDEEEYVLDSSENTTDGFISILNENVRTDIKLIKKDDKTKRPVSGATFGFYSKDDIYDVDGNIVVKKDELITKITTDADGVAKIPFDVPVMDEGYGVANESLNSGDYYFVEESVSESYYLNREKHYVHLEYSNQETKTVEAEAIVEETQTNVKINKYMIASAVELDDCHLAITDNEGNEIISWITGDETSIKVNDKLEELGYLNFRVEIEDKNFVSIYGLLQDKEYTLTERKPAEGYATASDIVFMIKENISVTSNTTNSIEISSPNIQIRENVALNPTLVYVKENDTWRLSEGNKVIMYDDTTKVEFSKVTITGDKELPGCQLEVIDKDTGTVMDRWISTENTHIVEGKYVVGKTYILSEKKPADGFVTATDIEFKVENDGSIQTVKMVDDTTKVEFSKIASDTKKQLKGAKYKVYDSKGKLVYKFTTKDKAEFIEGVFKVGETYTFKEVDAPNDYQLAKDKKITIKDTGKIQKISVVDIRIPTVPDIPKTGFISDTARIVISIICLIVIFGCYCSLRVKDKSKYKMNQEDKDSEENNK